MSDGDGNAENNNNNNNNNNGGDGGGGSNWRDTIPEQLRELPFFKNAESIDRLAEDINNAAQHMGNSLRIPSENASEDDLKTFHQKAVERIPGLMAVPNPDDADTVRGIQQKLGMPENSEDYRLPEVEGVDWAQHDMGALKARAHSVGMTQGQFNQFVSGQMKEATEQQQVAEHKQQEDMTALKGEWGAAYESRMQQINGLLNSQEGVPGELLESVKNGSVPTGTLRWLYNMADSIGAEGGPAGDDRGAGSNSITPDEALHQIQEIQRRPEFSDPSSPLYPSLVQKNLELHMLAYPDSDQDGVKNLRA